MRNWDLNPVLSNKYSIKFNKYLLNTYKVTDIVLEDVIQKREKA
jgi:hypothetical protein